MVYQRGVDDSRGNKFFNAKKTSSVSFRHNLDDDITLADYRKRDEVAGELRKSVDG